MKFLLVSDLTREVNSDSWTKITCIQKTYFCRCRWLCPFALPLLTKHSLQLQRQGRQWKGRLVNGRGGHKLPMLSMSRQKLKGKDQMNIHCVYVSKMNVTRTKTNKQKRFCSMKCVKIRSLPFDLTKHIFPWNSKNKMISTFPEKSVLQMSMLSINSVNCKKMKVSCNGCSHKNLT